MTTTHDQRENNDIRGLLWLQKFGWLRADELGILMFPRYQRESQRVAGSRLLRGWEKRKLVLLRTLENGAGIAAVLSLGGARFLRENGYDAATGKDLGELLKEVEIKTPNGVKIKEIWRMSASQKHDLIATGVLARLHQLGYDIRSERELRAEKNEATKIPDGIAKAPGSEAWIWIEIEHARKTGPKLKQLGEALALAAAAQIKKIGEIHCSAALVAYCDMRDERGYAINHKARVLKAVSEHCENPVKLALAHFTTHGEGVGTITLSETLVEPQKALAVLRILNANGWTKGEREILSSHYGKRKAFIWPESHNLWGWMIEGHMADYATAITEAKLLCARAIALQDKDA